MNETDRISKLIKDKFKNYDFSSAILNKFKTQFPFDHWETAVHYSESVKEITNADVPDVGNKLIL